MNSLSMTKSQGYLPKVLGILIRPNLTYSTIELKQRESIISIVVLYVVVLLRGIVELNYINDRYILRWLILGSALGLLSAWFGLSVLYHWMARILGGSGKFKNTLLLMGYSVAPMIITTFLSLLVYIVSLVMMPEWSDVEWGVAQNIIGWVGMIWGWPGVLCYYVLRYGEGLSRLKAGMLVGIVLIVTVVGWIMPFLVPGLFI